MAFLSTRLSDLLFQLTLFTDKGAGNARPNPSARVSEHRIRNGKVIKEGCVAPLSRRVTRPAIERVGGTAGG